MKKFNLYLSAIIIGLSAILTSGCATILSGENQQISISSNVSGAKLTINGREMGQTPWVGLISRVEAKSGLNIGLSKPGYETLNMVVIGDQINNVFFVNIISGGVFGSTTDFASGAMWQISPSTVYLNMVQADQNSYQESSFARDTKIKDFIFNNYNIISSELSSKKSDKSLEAANALADLSSRKVSTLREMHMESNGAVEFAEKVSQ